jgi:RND family efflux transporter MFP subunit
VTAQVQKNQADVAAEEAALTRAQLDLDYTNLHAPFSGIVVKTYVDNFENIRAKQPTIRLVDSSRIEMIVDIPESLISLVPQVKETIAVFDAFPDRLITGTIKEIGTEASDTTRTYPVTLIMDQPEDIKILPGMAGRVSASTPPQDVVAQAGIEIPVSATFTTEEPGSTFVWVIDETSKTVSQRRVRTGNLTDRGITITEGLSPGEWIAIAGVHYLREGQQVKILAQ